MGQISNRIAFTDTTLALKMLARTRELLDNGNRWRPSKLASGRLGLTCDPLSPRAYCFSLVGAAIRAQWELRNASAETVEDDIQLSELLKAISSFPESPYCGTKGWQNVESILTGLEGVLLEYQETEWLRRSARRA